MVLGFFSRFVDSNDREVRRVQPLVAAANALEQELQAETDAEIRARMDEIRAELAEVQAAFGATPDELEQDDPARRRDLATERKKQEVATAGRVVLLQLVRCRSEGCLDLGELGPD